MKRLFAGSLLLCAACAVAAEAPRKIVSLEGVTEYQLANGLRLLTLPDPGIDTATVHITYLVGSRHEGYGEKGMAHLLEHLRSEEHTSELQSHHDLVCRLLLEKKKKKPSNHSTCPQYDTTYK